MRRKLLIVFAIVALAACAAKKETSDNAVAENEATQHESVAPPTVDGVSKHITASDKDGTVEVRVGDKIQVELSGVPTAGYIWTVVETPAFLSASGEAGGPTTTAQSEPGFAGGNHWEVFYFDVADEGTGLLRLEQRRAWESEEPAADSFAVTINAVAAN